MRGPAPSCSLALLLLGCATTTTTNPTTRAKAPMGRKPTGKVLVAEDDSLTNACIKNPVYCRLLKVGDEAGEMQKVAPKPPTTPPEVPPEPPPPPEPVRPARPEIKMKWGGPEETPRDPRLPPLFPPGTDRLFDQSDSVEAAKKDKGKTPKDAPKETPKRKAPKKEKDPSTKYIPEVLPDVSAYPPGKRPCRLAGTGGEALGLPANMEGEIECRYMCGNKPVTLRPRGTAGDAWDICEELTPTW